MYLYHELTGNYLYHFVLRIYLFLYHGSLLRNYLYWYHVMIWNYLYQYYVLVRNYLYLYHACLGIICICIIQYLGIICICIMRWLGIICICIMRWLGSLSLSVSCFLEEKIFIFGPIQIISFSDRNLPPFTLLTFHSCTSSYSWESRLYGGREPQSNKVYILVPCAGLSKKNETSRTTFRIKFGLFQFIVFPSA